jgi:DNA-binding NarL/FixJ family response regulator
VNRENGNARLHESRDGGRLRVLLVDDHPAIRQALADWIDGALGIDICGEAGSAEEARQLISELRPDVVVVDLALEDAHGLGVVEFIQEEHPSTRALVFSMYDENVYAERAIRAGASGYLMKTEAVDSVIEAIRRVANGEIFLSPAMAAQLLSAIARGRASGPTFAIDELTEKELAVFRMLGQGLDIDAITDRMQLRKKTVEGYRRSAKDKLGFETVSELLQFAMQWTLGQDSDRPSPQYADSRRSHAALLTGETG